MIHIKKIFGNIRSSIGKILNFNEVIKQHTLPEYHMSQPSEWVCPNYNLDVVGQTNPENVSVRGTHEGSREKIREILLLD